MNMVRFVRAELSFYGRLKQKIVRSMKLHRELRTAEYLASGGLFHGECRSDAAGDNWRGQHFKDPMLVIPGSVNATDEPAASHICTMMVSLFCYQVAPVIHFNPSQLYEDQCSFCAIWRVLARLNGPICSLERKKEIVTRRRQMSVVIFYQSDAARKKEFFSANDPALLPFQRTSEKKIAIPTIQGHRRTRTPNSLLFLLWYAWLNRLLVPVPRQHQMTCHVIQPKGDITCLDLRSSKSSYSNLV
jgi:hypothetical protein